MSESPLYVRARTFPGDDYTSYWSSTEHAWGSLSSASVFTLGERKSFKKIDDQHAVITSRHGNDTFLPPQGEWEELPELVKLKSPKCYRIKE